MGYILDRNACLLPSYFAVNEITKVCADDKSWPHWVSRLYLETSCLVLKENGIVTLMQQHWPRIFLCIFNAVSSVAVNFLQKRFIFVKCFFVVENGSPVV